MSWSEERNFTVDTLPPEGLSVSIDKNGCVNPDTEFEITVVATEQLSTVKVLFQDILTDLLPSEVGFSRKLFAPRESGGYTASVFASDVLGNEIVKDNAITITVCEK